MAATSALTFYDLLIEAFKQPSVNRPSEIRTSPSRTLNGRRALVGRGSALALGKALVAEPLVIQAAHGQIDGDSRHPARLIEVPVLALAGCLCPSVFGVNTVFRQAFRSVRRQTDMTGF